jgi:hypothetical protein
VNWGMTANQSSNTMHASGSRTFMSPQNTQSPDWGLLANPGFERQKLKAVYFFAGNWRYHGQKSDDDPIQWYEFPVDPNYKKYTIYPLNRQHLGWSESQANRDFAICQMLDVGANVVVMSYWGERGNGPWTDPLDWNDRWVGYAPMHTSTMAHDQLFDAAVGKDLLIMPAIESSSGTLGCFYRPSGIFGVIQFRSRLPASRPQRDAGSAVDPADRGSG